MVEYAYYRYFCEVNLKFRRILRGGYFMKNTVATAKAITRFICLMLVLILCSFCAVGCQRNITDEPAVIVPSSDPSADKNDDAQNVTPKAELLSLIDNGAAKVRVVYSNKDSDMAIGAAKSLAASLTKLGGVDVYAVVDFSTDKKADSPCIVLGETSYFESVAAMSKLAPNSYSITISENKIIVVASNVYLYAEAIDELIGALSVSKNSVTLDKSFSKTVESDVVTRANTNTSDYGIVYPENDEEAKRLANELKKIFAEKGIFIQSYSDQKKAAAKEILIGDTNRKLSREGEPYYLNAHIGFDDKGNLAVTGNLAAGVEKLTEYLTAPETSEGRVDIPTASFGIVTPKGYGNAPEYTGSGTAKLYCGWESLHSYYVQAANATEKDYDDYIKKLEAEGFELCYSTDAQDSEFSIYTDGYNIVNLSYIEYLSPFKADFNAPVSYVSIAIDCIENSALPNLVAEGKKITDVQVTLVDSVCAFVIRLEDGSFIVFDGGHTANTGKIIYDTLCSQNVRDGNIVIAAWVISHTDGDHVGGFSELLKKYSDKVVLRSVIVNSPAYEKFYAETPGTADHTTGWAKTAYDTLDKYAPDAKIIIAHAGQRFEYLGLTVDVLGTYENLYDKPMKSSNHSNTVYSFTMPEGRMIFTGDAQNDNCKILNAIYAEELDADVVQYSHHGYNGGDRGFYDSVNASHGVWTNSYETMIERQLYGKIDYNGIDPKLGTTHLAMSKNDKIMILKAGMTEADLAKFIRFDD